MNKIQPFKFKSIDEFLDFLPEHELRVVEALRQIIFDCIPNCKEKLAYNVPFYSCRSNICFIWPSSIPWGNVQKDAVVLGFSKGSLLNDELNYLESNNRKKVRAKHFFSVVEIELDIVKTYLFEAHEIDNHPFRK
ncbi:DUF1801 domain-containing protein [Sunxiuqinia indica]|uniref:DUF1801 domain-containing protein n=1 Tax=Sunxiuqinia indica TaxID=2692584 RepID=UPI00135A9E44|nr:DUF1801 domain-containing protein [Sunxiuqinia indica]